MTALSALAPAKLNLFLHVTGRREDGYHELQTLFQLLDHGDRLHFEPQHGGVISLHVLDTHRGRALPMQDNLVLRAAGELSRTTGCKAGASISLDKRLPSGGGLGGGSADAGITLVALNELWRLELSTDELCRIGLRLGADVPLFIRGHSAWAEGIGELLEPAHLPEQWYLVLTPPCQVSTAMVFANENLTRNSAKIRIADFLAGRCRNVCEPVTRRLYPAVDEAFAWLGRFGNVRMSGTGASVFICIAEEAVGKEILTRLPAGWDGFTARGIDRLEHARQES